MAYLDLLTGYQGFFARLRRLPTMAPVDHEMRVLDAFAENLSDTVTRERLVEALRSDPNAVARAYQHSYHERESLHSWNDDAFRPIAMALRDVLDGNEYMHDYAIWEGIVESDLCYSLTEVMTSDSFFHEREVSAPVD